MDYRDASYTPASTLWPLNAVCHLLLGSILEVALEQIIVCFMRMVGSHCKKHSTEFYLQSTSQQTTWIYCFSSQI